jgi:hypothetical protein
MKKKPNYLIRRLIDNKISRDDMNEFLEGLEDDKTSKAYEEYLEKHFEEIMDAYQKVMTAKKPG